MLVAAVLSLAMLAVPAPRTPVDDRADQLVAALTDPVPFGDEPPGLPTDDLFAPWSTLHPYLNGIELSMAVTGRLIESGLYQAAADEADETFERLGRLEPLVTQLPGSGTAIGTLVVNAILQCVTTFPAVARVAIQLQVDLDRVEPLVRLLLEGDTRAATGAVMLCRANNQVLLSMLPD